MKKATRKQEIEIVREIATASLEVNFTRASYLDVLERRLGVSCTRVHAWRSKHGSMGSWEWEQLLHTLELGWKRYFYGCSHEDSIFCRIYCYLAARIPCTCCLWWRTVAIATTLTIASFFLGKYLP
jgi:hypothetical protein